MTSTVPALLTALAVALTAFGPIGDPPPGPPPEAVALAQQPAPVPAPAPAPPQFARGLKRTPQHKLAAVPQFKAQIAAPTQFAVIPPKLSFWLNNQIGDCVSAFEVAYSLAAYSLQCTGAEVFLPDATLSKWVYSHNYDNGADLADVMDTFQRDGVTVDGKTYKGGPYQKVDYSDENALRAAISLGPVPIAIDANALPSGAGNRSGWYASGGRPGQYGNTDHCTGLTGYGSADFCFGARGVPVPDGIDKSKTWYLQFTWNTIGVVDHDWIMSTTTEAYIRPQTIVGMSPPAPTPPMPPVPPGPTPVPPGPSPAPSGDFTTTTVNVYKGGQLVTSTTTLGAPANTDPPAAADLQAAGINPAVFVDVLQLLADLRAKPVNKAAVFADFLKLMSDFMVPAP